MVEFYITVLNVYEWNKLDVQCLELKHWFLNLSVFEKKNILCLSVILAKRKTFRIDFRVFPDSKLGRQYALPDVCLTTHKFLEMKMELIKTSTSCSANVRYPFVSSYSIISQQGSFINNVRRGGYFYLSLLHAWVYFLFHLRAYTSQVIRYISCLYIITCASQVVSYRRYDTYKWNPRN